MKKKVISFLLSMSVVTSVGVVPALAAQGCYSQYTGGSVSIVDALQSISVDPSYAHRKNIAKANGIANFHGTAAENTYMLSLLKAGELKQAA